MGRRVTANEALADGIAYVRDAWRDLWAVQALVTLGLALVFVSLMGKGIENAGDVFAVGAAVALVALAPLYGALYRLELGGKAERTLGPYGLQLGLAEGRLWSNWAARGVGMVFTGLAATAVSAAVFFLLGDLGMAHFGPLGQIRIAFIAAFAVWLGAGGYLVWALARLSLSSPASIEAERLVIADTWPMTAGRAISLAAVWVAARLPTLGLLILFALVDRLENGRIGLRPWPLPDAILGGLLIGGVLAFVQAPLAVGALASVWRGVRKEAAPAAFEMLQDTAEPHAPIAKPAHDRPDDPTERFRQILGDRPEPARY
jgi:hypothetical protein